MRTLKRNKQVMWYSIPQGRTPIYQKDADGEIIYIEVDDELIPADTGEYETTYSEPVKFKGYIGSQLEDAITRAWGSDNTNNFAVLVLSKDEKGEDGNYIELPNGTLIWRTQLPTDYSQENALYTVDGVMDEELNETSYYLRKRK